MHYSANEGTKKGGRNTGLQGGRLRRTVVALALMVALGAALTLLNLVMSRRDLALATGPESAAQREWFVAAADRPDIAQFFKGLPHDRRVAMARAIARYDDAPLAKLSGTLLADFDGDARAALAEGLSRVAKAHPEAVAEQLKQTGSFQQLGVFRALRSLGGAEIPSVVAALNVADARPSAVAYLVATGRPAIAPLLPKLDDSTPEVRLAAADALGGLRAREAVPGLLKDLQTAAPSERAAYLTALASIGDPSTAALFDSVLDDPTRPLAERAAVALGLGRIGGERAARRLWRYAPSDEPVLASAALAALTLVGPPAFDVSDAPPRLRARLAPAPGGRAADAVLRRAFRDPDLRLEAVRAAKNRPDLASDLAHLVPSARTDGELASAIVESLPDRRVRDEYLAPYRNDPDLAGFLRRAAAQEPKG